MVSSYLPRRVSHLHVDRAGDALAQENGAFRVVSQDDPRFPAGVGNVVDDRQLDHSWLNQIESTPTLIRYEEGAK